MTEIIKNKKKNGIIGALVGVVVLMALIGIGVWTLFSALPTVEETKYLYVDADDDFDSVLVKIDTTAQPRSLFAFKTLASWTGYSKKVRTGRYEVAPDVSPFTLVRKLKNGEQTPIQLTVSSTWTKEMLAAKVAKQLMADSAAIATAMNDPELCAKYGMDPVTIVTVFIPNTYEMYWNVAPETFVDRMYKEYERFWTKEREAKAKQMNMSRLEVVTLASIVDAETANNGEKPMIAGLYLNRFRKGMLLQADPTVKYALGDFGLRRIYASMLRVQSPYNTYVTKGLPPSPIRVPGVESIDAVLNHVEHDYLFMCAKEDFSGTHNFAATFAQHQANARRYVAALNARNIK